MLSALLTHSVGQGPVALQLLCFYFPQPSPLHHHVLQPGGWGCCCCETPLEGTSSVRMQLLPLTPLRVTQPSARECGYDQGILFFSPSNLQLSVFLFSSLWQNPLCFSDLGLVPAQCCFCTWEETAEWCHCTISSYFYKTSGIQSIALLMSHSSRQEHWNVCYLKPRRHALAFIVTAEIFSYSKLLRRNIDSFIQNNDTQNCWIMFPEHLSWRKIGAAIPVLFPTTK